MLRPTSFFNDYEVHKYTHSEKIQYIFKSLIAYLKPVWIDKHTETYEISFNSKKKSDLYAESSKQA